MVVANVRTSFHKTVATAVAQATVKSITQAWHAYYQDYFSPHGTGQTLRVSARLKYASSGKIVTKS